MERILLTGITTEGLRTDLCKNNGIVFLITKIFEYCNTFHTYEIKTEEGTLKFLFEGKHLKLIEGDISLIPSTSYEVCSNCRIVQPFGFFTVMNSVDKVIQIPQLLERIGQSEHSHIMCCDTCKKYFVEKSDIILTDEEKEECNRLWEEQGEF